MPPRIVCMHDKTKRFAGGGNRRSCLSRQADDHERPARRRAHSTRTCRFGGVGQSLQRRCIGMTERQAYAIGECAVTQSMQADGLLPLIPAQARRSGNDKQVFDGGTEHGDAFRREYVACAGAAAALRQNFKQARDGGDAIARRNGAEIACGAVIAANADTNNDAILQHFSTQAHVGGKHDRD